MIDREKVIKGLQIERECVSRDCNRDCGNCDLVQERDWLLSIYDGALALLKEQEARELSVDEWREWKANPNRNPICELWENDTSPIWVLYPNNVSELALLMGKLKLFTGKPTLEQCKAVKWDG